MKNMLKKNLFYIGAIVFSLTLFVEHLFAIKMEFTEFCKGLGVGLELAGVYFLIKKKRTINSRTEKSQQITGRQQNIGLKYQH